MADAMICPKCRSRMNCHAEKITSYSPETHGFDPLLGGVVEEFHSCPTCGAGVSRLAAS